MFALRAKELLQALIHHGIGITYHVHPVQIKHVLMKQYTNAKYMGPYNLRLTGNMLTHTTFKKCTFILHPAYIYAATISKHTSQTLPTLS